LKGRVLKSHLGNGRKPSLSGEDISIINSKFDPPAAGIDPNPALLDRNPKQIQNPNYENSKQRLIH